MIDPGRITPLLSNMKVERQIAKGPRSDVYLVTRRMDGKKLALKHISIPKSEAQTRALIYAGAVKNEAEAQRYYNGQIKELKEELLLLNGVKKDENLLKFRGYQVDQKYVGAGYDVYMLSDYCQNLTDYGAKKPFTKLQAANLAIDLTAALAALREAGLIHRDVHPRNIFYGAGGHFLLGDLGLAKISDLRYCAMPDGYITDYTAPEVRADSASPSETMDIYSVGLVLYEIYNGGELPEGRGETEPLPSPAYADVAMSEIILRACAPRPEERYRNPGEMNRALVEYLQRGNVSDQPLVPRPQPEQSPDDATVNISEIAATVAAGQAAEKTAGEDVEAPSGQEPESLDDTRKVELPQDSEPREPEPLRTTLRDLKEDDLLVPAQEGMSVEEFMASLRGGSGLEVLSMDSEGNMTSVPGYETEETLPEDTEFMDSADNHFAVLKNLAEMDENRPEQPVQPDETLDFDADDLTGISPDFTAGVFQELADAPREPVERPRPGTQSIPRPIPAEDDVDAYDSGEEYDDGYEDEPYSGDQEKSGAWKKVLITVIVLLVLAGGATALYVLKTDTIRDMETQVLSSTAVSVLADTKNNTPMEVVCTSASGEEVARVPLTEGGAAFTDLSPDTTYTFSITSTDGKFLLGSKTVRAKTKEMTSITGFAPTSLSAVSASLALGGIGPQPEKWVITLTADSGEVLAYESAEIPQGGIVVDGLTPETHYTAVVSKDDGDPLGGATSCEFTTMAYTELSSFEVSEITKESVSLTWSYSGTVPDAWTVSWEDSAGNADSQEIVGTECVISGLTTGESYNITLSTPSLKATELSAISVGIPAITVTGVTAQVNEDGQVEVSWEYTGDTTPSVWRVAYSYAGDGNGSVYTVTSDTNSVVLTDLIPDTDYLIEVVGADDLNVESEETAACQTGPAEDFTGYGCTDPEMTLYVLEDNPDELETESDSFTTEEHIAFAIQVGYDVTEEDKTVATTYVVRNSSGIPVQIHRSERTWRGSWSLARHTGDLPNSITEPGSYTLEVYFDGDFLASADFTVS